MEHIELYTHIYPSDFHSADVYANVGVVAISPRENTYTELGLFIFNNHVVSAHLTTPTEIYRYLLKRNSVEDVQWNT